MLSARDETGSEDIERRAQKHLADTLVVDGLGGSLVSPEPWPRVGETYVERLKTSGVNSITISLSFSGDFEETLQTIAAYFDLFESRSESLALVTTASDVRTAHREGRIGVILGSQSGNTVGRQTWRWEILHRLGLRVCQLTYNERSELGDGCQEPENRGLTYLGRQAVQEMNRLGIVVDLSHAGTRTALDATRHSTKPVVYSHSNAKALTPSARNLTDEQMKLMAESGGLMGISSYSLMAYRKPELRPTVEDYLNHVDYAVNLIGIDHVGIGSDIFEGLSRLDWERSTKRSTAPPFPYEGMYVEGYETMYDLPNVIRGFVERGYADADIEKLLGANWLRVFSDVWGA